MPRGSFLFKVHKKGVLKPLRKAVLFGYFSVFFTVKIRYEKIYYGAGPRNDELQMHPL